MNEYVSTALFWFTLACITAGLAEQKGRSRWTWFLLSLLLGPLAIALVVVWDPPANPVGRFADSARAASLPARSSSAARAASD